MRNNQVTRNELIDVVNTWGDLLDRWNRSPRWTKDAENSFIKFDDEIEEIYGISGAGLILAATGAEDFYEKRDGTRVEVIDPFDGGNTEGDYEEEDLLAVAGRMYDPELHDPDSIFFNDSYVGPSERELMGGCNRCGGLDDCYCD